MSQTSIPNQTQFAEEQPFFEAGKHWDKQTSSKQKKAPLSKKKLLIIGIVVTVIIAILFTLMIRLLPRRQSQSSPETSPTPSAQTDISELDKLFQELDNEIKNADPANNVLPFPPVETVITVSPETR